jgi:lactate dehydrogenase-like 2-hydroxyacid dehydrogenase
MTWNYAGELKLTVTRVPAAPHAVAEHAVSLLLTLNRKIHRAFKRVRELNFSLSGLVRCHSSWKNKVIPNWRLGQS